VSAKPKLVVGLGNPGREYEGTRHNIGFDVLAGVAEKFGCSFRNRARFSADVAEVVRESGKIVLAKPQTYMNRSGVAVSALVSWLKAPPAELLVVVDDADLPLGQIRLRSSGGSGGHNGLRSIIEALGGAEDFARLRVGIGRSGRPGLDITDHVLSRFAAAERDGAREAAARATEAVVCCLEQGVATAMNRFNRKYAVQEGDER
jgi:PTH1 family peptidyl-tRNA hydrolase